MKKHIIGFLTVIGLLGLVGCKDINENSMQETMPMVEAVGEQKKTDMQEVVMGEDDEKETNVSFSDEIADLLSSLDTYNEIAWEVVYSPVPYYEGVVVSATTYQLQDTNFLLVGITNLYDTEMTFYGSGTLTDNEKKIKILEQAIGSKNTIVRSFELAKETDCAIFWDDLDIRPAYEMYGQHYIPWNMECKELDELERLRAGIKKEDTTTFAYDYFIFSEDPLHQEGKLGDVYLFLLNADKEIIYQKYFDLRTYPFHDKNYFSDQLVLSDIETENVVQMVCFANPVTDRE